MAIITLTTDFGWKDPYVGAVKGAIYKELKEVTIVDISHDVTPFNIAEAAYIIQNAYHSFPEGTIHIIGVDAEHTPENIHIAVLLKGHYFICADNGVLALIMNKLRPEKLVEINIHDRITSNFTTLDAFVSTACHIARGGTLEVIGKPLSRIRAISGVQPKVSDSSNSIYGQVIYIDNYGNSVTNISEEIFDTVGKGRAFEISARNERFTKIFKQYSDIINFEDEEKKRDVDGKGLVIFNSAGYLEMATYKSNPLTVGSASSLFGLKINVPVIITFKDS
ncbi:SAM hydrolase/SAM-dependent halogenase family protein [Nonlabens xiamenensis]|uniref:SAM hydrolase/SAM-dependent halogenase family protein n=1 Tax=Nonlabens xiamenensis TaxID=2341043 RepID=UPI000F610377|nr:SAM-dependent chlorinase/fluorinase [Nonlabens xiamenensis]